MTTKLLISGVAIAAASISAFALTVAPSGRETAPGRDIVVVPAAAPNAPPQSGVADPVAGAVKPSDPWVPALADTWQWQLTGRINTSYDARIYDVDLFETPRRGAGAAPRRRSPNRLLLLRRLRREVPPRLQTVPEVRSRQAARRLAG